MNRQNRLRAIFFLIGMAYLMLLGILLYTSPVARADVWVGPDVENADTVKRDLERRLTPEDGINITLTDEKLTITTDGWPTQEWVDTRHEKVRNVTARPVDQAKVMIRDIHLWQAKNPKPEPPKPPAPPEPPPPPTDWGKVAKWGIIGAAAGLVGAVGVLLVRARRRRQALHNALAARAEAAYREAIGEEI